MVVLNLNVKTSLAIVKVLDTASATTLSLIKQPNNQLKTLALPIYARTMSNGKTENKLEVIAIEHDHAEGIISATKSALSKVRISDNEMSSRIVGFVQMGQM